MTDEPTKLPEAPTTATEEKKEEPIPWSPTLVVLGVLTLGIGILFGLYMSSVTLFK